MSLKKSNLSAKNLKQFSSPGLISHEFEEVHSLDGTAFVKKDGSRDMTGDQSMGTHKLTNLGAASAATDAVQKQQAVLVNGSQAFTADQSMGTHKLTAVTVLGLSGLTATQIGALSATAGMIVFNSTSGKHQGFDGTIWNDLY